MYDQEKFRLVTISRFLVVSWFCLGFFTHAAYAQSAASSLKIIEAVPASASEYTSFLIKKGETSVSFIVEAPVEGLIYFDADTRTGMAVEAKFFSRNGGDLGVGGKRITRPGRLKVRLTRRNSYDTEKNLHFEGRFVLLEKDPDIFEPNDTPGAAQILKLGPDNPIAGGPAMIFPAGDIDWFRLQVTAPGLVTPYVLKPDGAELTVRGFDADGKDIYFGRAMNVDAGVLAFKITGSAIGFELIEIGFAYEPIWSDCKSNIRRQDACLLQPGKPVTITLRSAGGGKQSVEKWYSMLAPEPGYIALSLSGMPRPKYNDRNIQTAGLKLKADVFFTEDGSFKYIPAHVAHGSVTFNAKKPGIYKIRLRGNWLNANSRRAMKLTPHFRRYVATSNKKSDLAIVSMVPGNQSGQTALGLSLLAGVGRGYYTNARTPEKIKSVMKEFIGGIDQKRPEAPSSGAASNIVQNKPKITSVPKPAPTAEQIEIARLNKLRTYLEAENDRFLYRHHFQTPSGKILKRLEKGKQPEKIMNAHIHVKTEKLSPVISRRLLVRNIQNLE